MCPAGGAQALAEGIEAGNLSDDEGEGGEEKDKKKKLKKKKKEKKVNMPCTVRTASFHLRLMLLLQMSTDARLMAQYNYVTGSSK